MKNTPIFILFVILLSSCVANTAPSAANAESQLETPLATIEMTNCSPAPIEIPKLPAEIPGYAELDEATGLHITGKAPDIDFSSYRLRITGLVNKPLSLTYDNLRCLPKVTATPLLVCPGFFEDLATWSGVPVYEVLKLAELQPNASKITLISADGYRATMDLEVVLEEENFLAYELEGQPLPILHGFPLRAIFPHITGGKWVKWLVEIIVE